MFGRSRVVIKSYSNSAEFEQAANQLARRGYAVAEVNGEPASLSYDHVNGKYLVNALQPPQWEGQDGWYIVTYARSSAKHHRRVTA